MWFYVFLLYSLLEFWLVCWFLLHKGLVLFQCRNIVCFFLWIVQVASKSLPFVSAVVLIGVQLPLLYCLCADMVVWLWQKLCGLICELSKVFIMSKLYEWWKSLLAVFTSFCCLLAAASKFVSDLSPHESF